MTVRLRPHHLLCVLTYRGEGYSPAFCANLDAVVDRIARAEAIEICTGPDEICAPLAGSPAAHCGDESISARDAAATQAIGELLGTTLVNGAELRIDGSLLDRERKAFAAGTIRAACVGCEWHSLCTDIARRNFAGVRLVLPGQTS
jgi:hypothetical protein